MNIALLGASGQLGQALQACAGMPLHCFDRADVNLLSLTEAQIIGLIEQHKIEVLINCAAYTAVDQAETESANAFAINADAVAVLAKACARTQTRLLHVSSDYVFSGEANKPYKTCDAVSPQSVYGKSKALGEQLLFQHNPAAICVRSSWLYSAYGHNFVKTILRLLEEKPEISVVNDQIGAPTWAVDLAGFILLLAARPECKGLFHYSNRGQCSWYEFACLVQQIAMHKGLVHKHCRIKPVSSNAYPQLAKRPHYSVLDLSDTVRKTGVQPPTWQDSLANMLEEF